MKPQGASWNVDTLKTSWQCFKATWNQRGKCCSSNFFPCGSHVILTFLCHGLTKYLIFWSADLMLWCIICRARIQRGWKTHPPPYIRNAPTPLPPPLGIASYPRPDGHFVLSQDLLTLWSQCGNLCHANLSWWSNLEK